MWCANVWVTPWFCECGSRVKLSEARAQRMVSAWAAPAKTVEARRAAARPMSLTAMVRFPLLLWFAAVARGHDGIWVEEFMEMRVPDGERPEAETAQTAPCRPALAESPCSRSLCRDGVHDESSLRLGVKRRPLPGTPYAWA